MTKLRSIGLGAILLLCGTAASKAQNKTFSILSYDKIANGSGGLDTPIVKDDRFGDAVCALGDMDGDNYPEIAVGADYFDNTKSDQGLIYIVSLNSSKQVRSYKTIYVSNAGRFGLRITNLGDLDGDGVVDLAVGAISENSYAGAVYICYLNSNGTLKSSTRIASGTTNFMTTLPSGAAFGHDVANAGDMDGDGINDLLATAPFENSNTGSLYIIYMKANGSVKGYKKITNMSSGMGSYIKTGDYFGLGLAGPGDLDGDGIRDIIVGAPYHDGVNQDEGAVFILFMNANGTVNHVKALDCTSNGIKNEMVAAGGFGISLTYLKDYSLGTPHTLAIGGYNSNNASDFKGAVYLVGLDSAFEATQIITIDNGFQSGWSSPLKAGDRFGLGVAGLGYKYETSNYWLTVGAAFDDAGGVSNSGAVYILELPDMTPVDTTTSGIAKQFKQQQLNAYPNPAASQVSVTLPGGSKISIRNEVELIDMQGRISKLPIKIQEGGNVTTCTFNIESLQTGMYVTRIQTADGIFTGRIVKQ